ncbi:MAG: glycerol-3-phosphate 1-O-acyltransferase PlsY [Candidatus Omnitrophota bacterium]
MDPITLKLLAGLLCSYLIGSLPTAFCFGKMTKGIDLRQHGSGNLGATNAFRVLGKGIGSVVLMLDILKGVTALLLAKGLFYDTGMQFSQDFYLCLAGIAVVSGHNWTVFLRFEGGKGVATSLGVLIGFSVLIERFAWIVVMELVLWLVLFLVSGYVSLASVVCSLMLPFFGIFLHLPKEITAFLLFMAILSLIRHKSNILRLLQKKENHFKTRDFLKKLSRKTFSR